MPNKFITIKNWKLALLTLLFISAFVSLGFWQLSRAHQKKILLQAFSERSHHTLTAQALTRTTDLRFFQIRLHGTFDNAHSFLLDNKIFHGQVGYELYTPFRAEELKVNILVDRGFLPLTHSRSILPVVREITGPVTITGMINHPPLYFALGAINESSQIHWPLRVEFIHLSKLATFLDYPLYPYLILIKPEDKAAYPIEWQILTMSPEKHLGYAVQWFALALTLLILFIALNRTPRSISQD